MDYLIREWSEESAINFIDEVELVLDLLKINPKLYPKSDYKSIRRAVVLKQITLFYQIEKSSIFLVRFWNNYKNPLSLF
ncbi:MAG: type II toxin-antitoxin system RelE/ParE family toxin [Bacteroidetes bacterium]|nr:MAG: type II toxin-antitoxin system RelE/ParE family toxin [Bacteroidota bacterium]